MKTYILTEEQRSEIISLMNSHSMMVAKSKLMKLKELEEENGNKKDVKTLESKA